jgi:uncharacterized phage-associated protein
MMANVFDVAEYILTQLAPSGGNDLLTTWKLQKLVYYSQAWSLVWDEKPLFHEPIEAWANGPVCPALYAKHKGRFSVQSGSIGGSALVLDADEKDTVDSVLSHYGDKTGQWLSDLTHEESPWKDARVDTAPGSQSGSEITLDSMAAYYSSL